MGLVACPREARRSGAAHHPRVAVDARAGRAGWVSGGGGGGKGTHGGVCGNCGVGGWGSGAPVAAGRQPRRPGQQRQAPIFPENVGSVPSRESSGLLRHQQLA